MTGVSGSCGACKFLRRKCTRECVFAPFFSYDEAPMHFSAVHKVFGASNASRMLLHLPEQHRSQAAISLSFQALAQMQDPVHGCVAYVYTLQQQIANLQQELEILARHIIMKNNVAASDSRNSQGTTTTITTNSLHLSIQEGDQDRPMDPLDYRSTTNAENESFVCNYSKSFNSNVDIISQTQPVISIPDQCDQAPTLFSISYPWADGRIHRHESFDIPHWLIN